MIKSDFRSMILPSTLREKEVLLLVDDTPEILQVYGMALKAADRDIVALTDSREALNVALAEPFDLILLDVQMPGLDGFEFYRVLKADSLTKRVPVVFASGDPNAEAEGMASCAVACLRNPFGLEALQKAVNKGLAAGKANENPKAFQEKPGTIMTPWSQGHGFIAGLRKDSFSF